MDAFAERPAQNTVQDHSVYLDLIARCRGLGPVATAVVHPCDPTSIAGAVEAAMLVGSQGWTTAVATGPSPRHRAIRSR